LAPVSAAEVVAVEAAAAPVWVAEVAVAEEAAVVA
jgi:hypothetical protein